MLDRIGEIVAYKTDQFTDAISAVELSLDTIIVLIGLLIGLHFLAKNYVNIMNFTLNVDAQNILDNQDK